jgi:hypothetical protein
MKRNQNQAENQTKTPLKNLNKKKKKKKKPTIGHSPKPTHPLRSIPKQTTNPNNPHTHICRMVTLTTISTNTHIDLNTTQSKTQRERERESTWSCLNGRRRGGGLRVRGGWRRRPLPGRQRRGGSAASKR